MSTLTRLDARIPQWDLTALVARRCPFCVGEGTDRYVRPDALHIRYCARCGAFYVSPAPGEDELGRFYAHYHLRHCRYVREPRDLLSRAAFTDPRIVEIASMMDLKGKRVLDVGFGQGQDMVCFRKLGAEVTGIDLDPYAVEAAKTKLGFTDAAQCAITELGEEPRYDLITLHDLLEHPLDPLATLQKAARLLRPNGLLSIWTPNASFAFDEDEPVLFRVDLEHMQYMAFKTCAYAAGMLSLEIVHLEGLGNPWLEGIQEPARGPARTRTLRNHARRFLMRIPGVPLVGRLRNTVSKRRRYTREGRYHLFCILRRGDL